MTRRLPELGSSSVEWLCVLAIIAALGISCFKLASTDSRQRTQIAQFREQLADSETLRVQAKELPKLRVQIREIESLRRNLAELPALREQVAELSRQRELTAKLQSENQELRASIEQQRMQVAQARAQQFQASGSQENPAAKMMGTCIANLKQMDGATQQWALENRLKGETPVIPEKVGMFLKGGKLPVCPAGGVYSFGLVQDEPRCNVHGTIGQPTP